MRVRGEPRAPAVLRRDGSLPAAARDLRVSPRARCELPSRLQRSDRPPNPHFLFYLFEVQSWENSKLYVVFAVALVMIDSSVTVVRTR